MELKQILSAELSQLKPLIGKWIVEGSFKGNPEKSVDDWKTYEISDGGKSVLCNTETRTLKSEKVVDVYNN